MKKPPKIYKARTLFHGSVVGKDPTVLFVGIPGGQNYESNNNFSKEKNFIVDFEGKRMTIKNWHKAEAFRKFDDLQGRGTYTLAYFQWKPIEEPEQVSATLALGGMVGTPEWENLRDKLHPKKRGGV